MQRGLHSLAARISSTPLAPTGLSHAGGILASSAPRPLVLVAVICILFYRLVAVASLCVAANYDFDLQRLNFFSPLIL
jgi:hypothetical protein